MNDSIEQATPPEVPLNNRKALAKRITSLGSQLPDSFNNNDPTHIEHATQLYNLVCELVVGLPGGEGFDKTKWSRAIDLENTPLIWMDKEPGFREYSEFQIKLKNEQKDTLDINLRTGDVLGEELRITRTSNNSRRELYLSLSDTSGKYDYIGSGTYKDNTVQVIFDEDEKINAYRDGTFSSRPPEPTIKVPELLEQIVGS